MSDLFEDFSSESDSVEAKLAFPLTDGVAGGCATVIPELVGGSKGEVVKNGTSTYENGIDHHNGENVEVLLNSGEGRDANVAFFQDDEVNLTVLRYQKDPNDFSFEVLVSSCWWCVCS